jgi:LCP family protein required for cell wall assembly
VSSPAPKHSVQPPGRPPAAPPKRPKVRVKVHWPRRTLIGANVVVLVCLIAMGAAYGYVRYKINDIRTAPSPFITPPGCFDVKCELRIPKSETTHGDPENILLIGNETRQGLTPQQQLQFGSSLTYSGTLADIMMVLHLDPANHTASILSIPRDLFSAMPAHSPVGSYQKMDAALNDGPSGADNLAAAIEDDLGIPINHFIELNFNGFINSVNALGGINVYFPDPVFDAESLLNIGNAGCHHLDGFEALALVRARHLQYEPQGTDEPRYDWPYDPESDLARIVRTHTFLKIVAQTAKSKGLTDPVAAANFLSAILGQMTVDAPLKSQMLSLILSYSHIDPSTVPETTLPTTGVNDYYYGGYGMGDVLFPVQPADNNVIKAWAGDVFPTPVPPTSVSVVSIVGSYEAAVAAGQALATHGLKVTNESSGEVPANVSETLVNYRPGDVAQALDVMKYLSGAVMLQVDPSLTQGAIEVDLGSTVDVSAKAPTPTTPSTSAAAPTTGTPTTGTPTTGTPTTRAPAVRSSTTVAPSTTVPTPGGNPVSASADQEQPWDPRAC